MRKYAPRGEFKVPRGYLFFSKLPRGLMYPGGKVENSTRPCTHAHAHRDGQDLRSSVQGVEVGRGGEQAHPSMGLPSPRWSWILQDGFESERVYGTAVS